MSGAQSESEPNLTPILDMVFQLITFFMMVITFKDQSIDRNLKLPAIGSAVAVEQRDASNQIVLNVNAAGELIHYGNKRDDFERFFRGEANAALKRAQRENRAFKAGDELPATVVLRVDSQCDMGKLDRILGYAQQHNFRRFQFNSSTGQKGRR